MVVTNQFLNEHNVFLLQTKLDQLDEISLIVQSSTEEDVFVTRNIPYYVPIYWNRKSYSIMLERMIKEMVEEIEEKRKER